MILEFDIGNSRCKWRVVSDAGRSASQAGPRNNLAWLDSSLPASGVTRIRLVSVAAEEGIEALCSGLEQRYGLLVERARSEAVCAGVVNSYEEPARLGVDRWLALLAAQAEFGEPLLVVDAGSAMTLDLLGENGRHLGGYIVPGRRLQHTALAAGTDRVRVAAPESGALERTPGRSTEDAVSSGVALTLCGAVREAWGILLQQCPGAQRLVVTGGDGVSLLGALGSAPGFLPVWRPDLVLDGLCQALP